tara:strand:+ start:327 stop:539 length:213 start_codon:yes stop_codon:yes gene_type:complete
MNYETFKEMLDRLLNVESTIEKHLPTLSEDDLVELAHVHYILEREYPEYTKRFWLEREYYNEKHPPKMLN